jgi:hypothetical protein
LDASREHQLAGLVELLLLVDGRREDGDEEAPLGLSPGSGVRLMLRHEGSMPLRGALGGRSPASPGRERDH